MKLFGSRLVCLSIGLGSTIAQDCSLDDRKYNFYGCIIKRDGLTYPGDNGTSVFASATCNRAVCLKTKEKFYNVNCAGGKLNIPDDFCVDDDEIVEGILPNLGERLSTSGPSGSAHKTESTQQQPNPDDYPDRLIIFGSYTPGRLDTDSFKGQGVYQLYKGNDIERRFTQRKPVYQHTSDSNLFFSFTYKTMEWRITSKKSIAKKSSYCNFKAFYGILHDPTKFSSWTARKCFINKQWKDTDLTIADHSDDLRIRQRACPRDFIGLQNNAASVGQLSLQLQGANWQKDLILPAVLKAAPQTSTHTVTNTFNDIVAVEATFLNHNALCLSELSVMQGDNAINLLHLLKKGSKIQKWSLSWMVSWWDGNQYEDAAWPHGEVALVNPLVPNKLEDISHHYYKFVDFHREFILPKSTQALTSGDNAQEGDNKVTFKPIEEDREKPTPPSPPPNAITSSQAAGSSLHCDVGEMEKNFGLHFSNCKVKSKSRPSNSKTNQARFGDKIVNGSVCHMKCKTMPKKPFKNTKMECLCKSNSRFKLFQNLKELVSNGPNPLDLLFKSCHWYDRSKKTSTSPVIPINVFKVAKCPAGCDTSHLQVDHDCGTGIAKFNKKCSLKCPGAKKPVKTKCIWSKTQRKPTFSKKCPSSG